MYTPSKSAGSASNTTFLLAGLLCFIGTVAISAQSISTKSRFQKGDFALVYNGKTADILVSAEDAKVVQIAASDFAGDVERVTGKRPRVMPNTSSLSANAVIIGTLGISPLVDKLSNAAKIDTTQIHGKWESFIIATVRDPSPNIDAALVIVGSDRRGTAFGVYELSQRIGVSPWYWWADVKPEARKDLILTPGVIRGREPSVKYRGIFLNDEDWGLQPWAARTFEPEARDIGPKSYAKIFELLLRLKANTLWPAMHEVTRPFNLNPDNRKVAGDYAIIMGSSHAEPMLRNNVGEWKGAKESYNFVTNPKGVTGYWEERVKENGRYENIYTIGMRGIHDSPIQGTRSQGERISLLETIFAAQRELLTRYVNSSIEKVPQIFCPYKEVLADYQAGLKVPDDVTIVFPDDNFGYIRQFPTEEEQKRKGGFGVYYHISYLGRPLSYLWLNSTPPALIWQEMNKAYENGMRQLWIVNVGDIKPAEIGMEFFLQMAYDADRWTIENHYKFLKEWATREFDAENSSEIARILDQYYRLAFQRKPEHLQWYLPNETPRRSDLTETEILERLGAYADLRKRAETVYARMSLRKKDAFYELVLYPVRSAALANQRFFAAELADLKKQRNLNDASAWARTSIAANAEITLHTAYFNERLAGGKWRHIMSPEMNPGQWPSMRSTPPNIVMTASSIDGSSGERSTPLAILNTRRRKNATSGVFKDRTGVVSIEAENFHRTSSHNVFAWRVIKGLGKTGDSVSVFPARATTFAGTSPTLEYHIDIANTADFRVHFYLIPTQPLVPNNGLRLAFSIDGNQPKMILVDRETAVSSRKWAQNILDQTSVGDTKISLTRGKHTLRVFAVDTGVILDKIVFAAGELSTSYFGPPETRFANH